VGGCKKISGFRKGESMKIEGKENGPFYPPEKKKKAVRLSHEVGKNCVHGFVLPGEKRAFFY